MNTVPIYRPSIWVYIVLIVMWVLLALLGYVITSCTLPLFHNVPAFSIDRSKTSAENKIAWQRNKKERSRQKDWVD